MMASSKPAQSCKRQKQRSLWLGRQTTASYTREVSVESKSRVSQAKRESFPVEAETIKLGFCRWYDLLCALKKETKPWVFLIANILQIIFQEAVKFPGCPVIRTQCFCTVSADKRPRCPCLCFLRSGAGFLLPGFVLPDAQAGVCWQLPWASCSHFQWLSKSTRTAGLETEDGQRRQSWPRWAPTKTSVKTEGAANAWGFGREVLAL